MTRGTGVGGGGACVELGFLLFVTIRARPQMGRFALVGTVKIILSIIANTVVIKKKI
jgi:hypothetical protein